MRMSEKEYKEFCSQRNLPYVPPQPGNTTKKPIKNKSYNHQMFDSLAEEIYYNTQIKPKLASGEYVSCELHKTFQILAALPEYGYKERVYTPDFFITKQNGDVLVVEMKGKAVKKLQRDYPLRRHLFLEKYCVPNQWKFREEHSEEWTSGRFS